MAALALVIRSLFTPRLYTIYNTNRSNAEYQPNGVEIWSQKFLSSMTVLWKITQYASPLICIFLYKNDFLTSEGFPVLLRFATAVSSSLIIACVARAIGRAMNPQYQMFVDVFTAPQRRREELLKNYDYDFAVYPLSYQARNKVPSTNSTSVLQKSVMDLFGWIAVNTFGIRLIYPGTLPIIHVALWPDLLRGRKNMVELEGAVRHKVRTTDKNDIDCMFVDNRNKIGRKAEANGGTIVICCDGNSGFYEVGIMATPVVEDYSVLGWNHPGFGGSTGLPYPDQEQKAVEAMIEFATEKLGFAETNIIMYGWSIGGYTAAYAASQHQTMKCLFLDATFDELLPLALSRMPASWAPLVKNVVERYVNLNVGELAAKFPGEFKIVRRLQDEIICLREGDISSNCGNALLVRLLRKRYPELMSDANTRHVVDYLSLSGRRKREMLDNMLNHGENNTKLLFKMVTKHLIDYDSSHCNALREELFITGERE